MNFSLQRNIIYNLGRKPTNASEVSKCDLKGHYVQRGKDVHDRITLKHVQSLKGCFARVSPTLLFQSVRFISIGMLLSVKQRIIGIPLLKVKASWWPLLLGNILSMNCIATAVVFNILQYPLKWLPFLHVRPVWQTEVGKP